MTHRRIPVYAVGLFFLLAVLLPASLFAQETSGNDDSVVFQLNRPVTIAAEDRVDTVIVIDDDATIEGEVSSALIVVRGTATVTGTVNGEIFVVEGTLVLEDGAMVDDVTLVRSDLTRAEGATILGSLDENADFTSVGDGFTALSIAFRIAMGIAILLVSLVLMAFFGRPIQRAASLISTQALASGVAGLGTWIVLILLAIIAFVTIIGIPVSLGILFFLMPILALMGHIVASYWVGSRLGGLMNLRVSPYLLFIIGLVLMQLISAVPWIGGLVVFVVSLMGTGALVLYLWRARQEPAPESTIPDPVGGSATV